MAIAFDAASKCGKTSSVSSLTLSHTCSGSNRVLCAIVMIAGTARTCSGVTYAGTAMTEGVVAYYSADSHRCYIFYLANPATGANNIVATFSAAGDPYALAGISFTGANVASPFGASTTDVGGPSGSFNKALTTSYANSMIVTAFRQGGYAVGDSLSVYNASQVVRYSQIASNGGDTYSISNYAGSTLQTTSAGSYDTGFSGLATTYRAMALAEIRELVSPPSAPTNVSATDGTYTDKVTITWTKSSGATGYKVYEGANLLATLGDVATYDDTAAGAPTITAGSTVASDGTSTSVVALSLSGTSANNGATRTYGVKATNAGGDSALSSTDTGYRGVGGLTYQWQRSAGETDASYSDIGGATTENYNDTTAPAGGETRYYKATLAATGATGTSTAVDYGNRLNTSKMFLLF